MQQKLSFAQTHISIASLVQPVTACAVQHVPGPLHLPPTQGLPLQHSALVAQTAPSGLHMALPQTPFVQGRLLQHSALAAQAVPAGLHIGMPPQMPPTQLLPPQQSAALTHACPMGLQSLQRFLSHVRPVQQSPVAVHASPSLLHGSTQMPLRQSLPLQHSSEYSQLAPGGRQQVPLAQLFPSQHSALKAQE